MHEKVFETLLLDLIDFAADITEGDADDLGLDLGIDNDWSNAKVRTFEEAGVLTTDTGLVITLANGDQFYVTIQGAN